MRAIADGEGGVVSRLSKAHPELAKSALPVGATRQTTRQYLLTAIDHYVYAGDTALHVAAASDGAKIVRELLRLGAAVGAANRRQAVPLQYAVDGGPGAPGWRPEAQAETVTLLLEPDADPNVADAGGTTPLLRSVRNRCAAAVRALLDGGADAERQNKHGSRPRDLAVVTSGRGGSGSAEARAQQREILRLLGS
ncbi:MAG TPA: ankyrin repeat domain-containing protein [Acidobacteriaceae bacterium]|nr:ankyrin repeat domain-containing protein [Acidobacteriaceae bacterium]